MKNTDSQAKVIENIQKADNILVTVAKNPSVDALAAALGLTLQLNDMGKRATAVVSGKIPPAIKFLNPEQTFRGDVDSLRDFVIALNKDKADHLRDKLEGDVVKVFITPYGEAISESDLEFSRGDYNVDAIVAIGVKAQSDLDSALEAHGRIMHDVSVSTIGFEKSSLGTTDWHEENVSSFSEMVASLIQGIEKDTAMSDQVASAFLTGIIASTDRFTNERTTSDSMTMAARMMAAGANQQLIMSKLADEADSSELKKVVEKKDKPAKTEPENLEIDHKKEEAEKPKPKKEAVKSKPAPADNKKAKQRQDLIKKASFAEDLTRTKALTEAEKALDSALKKSNSGNGLVIEPVHKDLNDETKDLPLDSAGDKPAPIEKLDETFVSDNSSDSDLNNSDAALKAELKAESMADNQTSTNSSEPAFSPEIAQNSEPLFNSESASAEQINVPAPPAVTDMDLVKAGLPPGVSYNPEAATGAQTSAVENNSFTQNNNPDNFGPNPDGSATNFDGSWSNSGNAAPNSDNFASNAGNFEQGLPPLAGDNQPFNPDQNGQGAPETQPFDGYNQAGNYSADQQNSGGPNFDPFANLPENGASDGQFSTPASDQNFNQFSAGPDQQFNQPGPDQFAQTGGDFVAPGVNDFGGPDQTFAGQPNFDPNANLAMPNMPMPGDFDAANLPMPPGYSDQNQNFAPAYPDENLGQVLPPIDASVPNNAQQQPPQQTQPGQFQIPPQ